MLMWTPGIGELVVIFFIILLLFGGKKLPSLARSIGAGINEFKKGIGGQGDGLSDEVDEEPNTKVSEPQKVEKKKK